MPDVRPQDVPPMSPGGPACDTRDILARAQEHWVLLAGLVLLLVVVWFASGEPHTENGRYTLVKDDVPCQSLHGAEGDERRWCYLVFDTRTGQLEERTRKLKRRDRRS